MILQLNFISFDGTLWSNFRLDGDNIDMTMTNQTN